MFKNKNETLLLFILAGIQFTHIVDFMIIMPLGPTLMRFFLIGPKEFGLLVSSYTLSAGVSGLLSIFYVDKFDRKHVLLLTYLGFILGTLFCGLADTYIWLILARVATGAFGGVTNATIFSIVSDIIPFERRGKASGIIMSAFSLATVLGVPIGLLIASQWNWKTPFLILVLLCIIIWIISFVILPNVREHLSAEVQKAHHTLFALLKDKNVILAFLFMSSLMLAGFSVIPFISPYLVANVKILESELSYIYFVGGVTTLFTANLIGKLADKLGKKETFLTIASISTIPIGLITNLGQVGLVLTLGVTTLFFVFVSGRMVPAIAILSSVVSSEKRGIFLSLNTSVQQFASAFASFLSSSIIGKNFHEELTNYWMVGIVGLIFSFVSIYISQKIKIIE